MSILRKVAPYKLVRTTGLTRIEYKGGSQFPKAGRKIEYANWHNTYIRENRKCHILVIFAQFSLPSYERVAIDLIHTASKQRNLNRVGPIYTLSVTITARGSKLRSALGFHPGSSRPPLTYQVIMR